MEQSVKNTLYNLHLELINKSDYITIDSIETKEIPLEEEERSFYVR